MEAHKEMIGGSQLLADKAKVNPLNQPPVHYFSTVTLANQTSTDTTKLDMGIDWMRLGPTLNNFVP